MSTNSSSSTTLPASTYPRPETLLTTTPVRPRPLVPIRPPAAFSELILDDQWFRANQPSQFLPSWTRSTHVIPSAAPRSFAYGTQQNFVDGESKEDRRAKSNVIAQSLINRKVSQESGGVVLGVVPEGAQPTLVNVLDRYVRQGSPEGPSNGGVTLLLAHANGFPRRIWEPALRAILQLQEDPAYQGSRIEEVWSFEAVNHGDSALLNEEKLGDLFDWLDNSRDMLNFLVHYLPTETRGSLPTVLLPVPSADAVVRLKSGFPNRKVMGIGHSIGGCTMARAALDSPALWSSIILVDPVIIPKLDVDPSNGIEKLLAGAVSRRTRWSSKEEVRDMFLQSPFFQAWDPQVLQTYVDEGIHTDPVRGDVRLKQSGFQEACSFAERRAVFETWELLKDLDPRIPLFWIMSGRRAVVTGPDDITMQTVWRRSQNSSNMRMPGAGHLIVHEAPIGLARAVLGFLSEDKFAQGRISKL